MQKWEYTVVKGSMLIRELRELGDEGWELVTVVFRPDDDDPMYYFKRPKL